MDAAQASNLPLVAIEPFGVNAKVPAEVAKRAAEVVGWNERLITDAVRRQARHEDTAAVGHDRVQALMVSGTPRCHDAAADRHRPSRR